LVLKYLAEYSGLDDIPLVDKEEINNNNIDSKSKKSE